jgi:GT2 family glycosyltransferase
VTAPVAGDRLACVVLSFRTEVGLVAAVQSVLAQSEPVETIVINSGGGSAFERLRAAGIDVPVIDRPEPLFAGAVRNLGIEATRARYVSFLAADCLAAPGWVAGRLREHRAGAAAVAGVLTNAYPASLSARVFGLLLHYRMSPSASGTERLFYGLSYDRALFERCGKFREDLLTGEDTEFNARFANVFPVVFAPDVATAHRNPTTLGDLLRDTYRRGRRRARVMGQLGRRRAGIVIAASTLRGAPWGLADAWRSASRRERAALLPAALLVPIAALAYAAGAVAHDVSLRPHPPSTRSGEDRRQLRVARVVWRRWRS